jgi:hypothetical protein
MTASPMNTDLRSRLVVIVFALLALTAKIYCSYTTFGTTDSLTFMRFGQYIHEHGLIAQYRETPSFNHTPLVGKFVEAAYAIAYDMADDPAKNGADKRFFAYFLRLAPILADVCAVGALLWWHARRGWPPAWALALFAASPVAFMVSGFHGNVDSIMAMLLLLAGLACAEERPSLCGLFFGLSCNVKILPVLLAPAFFFFWLHRGRPCSFAWPVVVTVLVGWSYPLFHIPLIFLKNVLGYSSVFGVWGITYLLRLTGIAGFSEVTWIDGTPAQNAVITGLKLFVIAAVLVVSWLRRRTPASEIFTTLALVWSIFFVFAPGFGAQYLAWLAPALLMASPRWYAALTVSSSIALFAFYTAICKGLPWFVGFTVSPTIPQWAPWLLLPWLTLAAYLWASRSQLFPSAAAGAGDAPRGRA